MFCFSGRDRERLRAAIGEASRHEDRSKAANIANEWSIADGPVTSADIFAFSVAPAIDSNANNDENLYASELGNNFFEGQSFIPQLSPL